MTYSKTKSLSAKDKQEKHDLYYQLSQNIIYYRKKRGWTQEDLAKALETNQSVIWRIESGNQNLTLYTLKNIADVLGTDILSLLSGQKELSLKNNRYRLIRY